ncbi:LUD domain-containing protein [Nibrella saemangeumensis]|uniref:LUD domain-containing protein n=1 Tax=Nibrella saemangeumensis TaxID=1084526 RepID=A0ABP8MMJ8_9BACT
MSSRDQIIAKVRANKPQPLPLPEIPDFQPDPDQTFTRFAEALAFVGGQLVELHTGQAVADVVRERFPDAKRIAASVPLEGIHLMPVSVNTVKEELEQVDVAVLAGVFAVGENAAIWVPESNMLHRALPFITQHLVLVIDRNTLVATMHEAYRQIEKKTLSYGVFIAGPSKTADIEQSLVIGAHGARSLTVIVR